MWSLTYIGLIVHIFKDAVLGFINFTFWSKFSLFLGRDIVVNLFGYFWALLINLVLIFLEIGLVL